MDSRSSAIVGVGGFDVAGFVLAGGESTRMGRDKGLLELGGLPLVLRTVKLAGMVTAGQTYVVGNIAAYGTLGLCSIDDGWPGAGPLGGIATAVGFSSATWAMVLACDLPYLTGDWLRFLIRRALASPAHVVMPMNVKGAEPLCAMYHKKCEQPLRAALERGVRKVTEGVADVRCELIASSEWKDFDPEGFLFKNMNSPADYEEAKARLG